MTRVRLFEEHLLLARAWSDAVLRTGIEKRENHTKFSVPDRYFIGYLGELGVCEWCEHYRIAYVHRVNTSGQSAPSEFVVCGQDGERRLIEVKTAGKAFHQKLLVPVAQRKRDSEAAFYVGVRLDFVGPFHADLSVCGWLTGEQVGGLRTETIDNGEPTHAALLNALRPMPELADMLGNVRSLTRAA